MTRLRIAAALALAAGLTLLGAGGQGQAHADEVTVTITPTVVIVTDATGRPIRTETIIPTPPAATPADQPGPKTVTVTVAPPNPGVLTLGQNDAGQWIGMVIGAAWNGARAFTATAGPGISLMQEFLGLAYFAEIPAVIVDVQRGGPSTGMPTRTQQSDLLSAAYASHGDTKHVMLLPADPNECFTFAAEAFDLADRLQTPVFVMTDLDIGMNEWLVDPLTWDDGKRMDRGKVMTHADLEAGKDFGRYLDVDGDGIPVSYTHLTLPPIYPV